MPAPAIAFVFMIINCFVCHFRVTPALIPPLLICTRVAAGYHSSLFLFFKVALHFAANSSDLSER